MATLTIRDLLRLRDTRCRPVGIAHAEDFTLLTIAAALAPNSSLSVSLHRKETREPKEIPRSRFDGNRARTDKIGVVPEFGVSQEGCRQRLDRKRSLSTKP